jgi:uncharacterized protein (TIGR02145 family)
MEPICLFFGWFRKKERTDKKSEEVINKTHQTDFFIDPRDGNQYKWVKIGDQIWMAENLRYIPHVSPNHYEGGIWVVDYEGNNVNEAKETNNYQTYGCLYNWNTALECCPPGWHLPSDAEWTQLENYLIANGYNYDGTKSRNKIAKSMAATTNWITDSGIGAIGNNLSLNNKSGFSALPGAYSDGTSASFYVLGYNGSWWSSSEGGRSIALFRNLHYGYAGLHSGLNDKRQGFSVRCVRD